MIMEKYGLPLMQKKCRGDKARVYKESNYGLGLSIAKSVVQNFGGVISAESNSKRIVFTMRIPNHKKSYHS